MRAPNVSHCPIAKIESAVGEGYCGYAPSNTLWLSLRPSVSRQLMISGCIAFVHAFCVLCIPTRPRVLRRRL